MVNRQQLYDYKDGTCAYCNLSVREMIARYGSFERMFEFHHIDPSQKHAQYKNLIRRTINTCQLDEVDKCILLCNNCHGLVHSAGINVELELTVHVESRQAIQRIQGQLIIDHTQQICSVLTNDSVAVLPYNINIGANPSRLIFGTEMQTDSFLPTTFDSLAVDEILIISSFSNSNEVLLKVEKRSDASLYIEQDIRFSILNINFESDQGEKIWIRNGKIVMSSGDLFRGGRIKYPCILNQNCATNSNT